MIGIEVDEAKQLVICPNNRAIPFDEIRCVLQVCEPEGVPESAWFQPKGF